MEETKKSKKGKPMIFCSDCQKDVVYIKKLGGTICGQCRKIIIPTDEIRIFLKME